MKARLASALGVSLLTHGFVIGGGLALFPALDGGVSPAAEKDTPVTIVEDSPAASLAPPPPPTPTPTPSETVGGLGGPQAVERKPAEDEVALEKKVKPHRAAPPPKPKPKVKRRRRPEAVRTEEAVKPKKKARKHEADPAERKQHKPAKQPGLAHESGIVAQIEAPKAAAPEAKPAAQDDSKPKPKPDTTTTTAAAKAQKDEATATGDGSGGESKPSMLKFARTSATANSAGDPNSATYIGDRSVSAPKNVRVKTSTERSLGNGTGHGDALPTPKGHRESDTAPLQAAVVRDASAAPVIGTNSVAGAAAGGVSSALRLSTAGEVSDAQVAEAREAELVLRTPAPKPRRIRKKPKPIAIVEPPVVETAVLPEPIVAAAPADAPEPPDERDGFWGAGEASAETGSGDAAADTPEAHSGEDVKRQVFKKDGAGWTEITTLDDAVTLGDVASVGIRQTELGVWFTPVDDLVRAGWKPPLAEGALGAEGRVIVEFTILKNGKVRDVAMLDTNVSLAMQQAALAAVPAGVPPPPRGSGPLRIRYLFRYGSGPSPR